MQYSCSIGAHGIAFLYVTSSICHEHHDDTKYHDPNLMWSLLCKVPTPFMKRIFVVLFSISTTAHSGIPCPQLL